MTRVLIVEHAEAEGPGTLGSFLGRVEAEIRTVQAYKGDPFPDDIGGFDALVSMGGPMNVYEEGKYPFLREETEFLRRVINANIPTLGICLGAQLIAKACYAPVVKASHKEVGGGAFPSQMPEARISCSKVSPARCRSFSGTRTPSTYRTGENSSRPRGHARTSPSDTATRTPSSFILR
ncbi:MAG: type 1 glutamine amidotransferase [Syntrophales bacterium]|nr:type 1 glutamine amidotransferase [Syntrophales bacterium]